VYVEFAVLVLVADLIMAVKSLLPIEDVDVAVTTGTTLVGLSLPDDARSMDEEVTTITFDLDNRFAWRSGLIDFFYSISETGHNLTFKIAVLTFLSFRISIWWPRSLQC